MLVRAIAVLLCLLPAALAQGLSEDISEALDPRTSPARRQELLARIVRIEGGLNELAQRGLDGALDSDVVHSVVEAVFQSREYVPHVVRICGLLQFDQHREKTLTRIQDLGENPEAGQPLRKRLFEIARGTDARDDPKLRGAAVLALGRVPRRDVLEELVALGLEDATVRPAVLKVVKELGFVSLKGADQYLRKYRTDSVYDILRRRLAERSKELERFRELQLAQLKTADAKVVLAAMDGGDAETRLAASTRLKQLADKGEYESVGAKEFAGQVFDLFVTERTNAQLDAGTLANLLATLDLLARGADKAPLWLARERAVVVEALQPLAVGNARLGQEAALAVGTAAVSLLHAAGEPARVALAAFAKQFGQADARKQAIQSLGDIARRFEQQRDYVGRTLATMLPAEIDPAVRRQILATLNQRFVPAAEALGPIQDYLLPQKAPDAPALDDTEIRDCIGILGRIGSDPALALLRKVARGHPELRVRRMAVENGLLPWAARNGKEAVILKDLLDLVVGQEQPIEARQAVIEALGGKGTRNAHATLNEIVQTAGIDPALQASAIAAKLTLAERLAIPADGSPVTPEDLQSAVRILEEEKGAADLARIEKLARDIVRAGDAAKLPVGTARYRLVTFYLKHPETEQDRELLLSLYENAAGKAGRDGLPGPVEQELLLAYRTLLLAEPRSPERVRRAMACLERAAELEGDGDKKKAATLYLDAGELALEVKDAVAVERLRNLAMGTGGVGGDLVEREKSLRERAEALSGQQ